MLTGDGEFGRLARVLHRTRTPFPTLTRVLPPAPRASPPRLPLCLPTSSGRLQQLPQPERHHEGRHRASHPQRLWRPGQAAAPASTRASPLASLLLPTPPPRHALRLAPASNPHPPHFQPTSNPLATHLTTPTPFLTHIPYTRPPSPLHTHKYTNTHTHTHKHTQTHTQTLCYSQVRDILQLDAKEPAATAEAVDRQLDMLRGAISNLGGSVEVVSVEAGVATLK